MSSGRSLKYSEQLCTTKEWKLFHKENNVCVNKKYELINDKYLGFANFTVLNSNMFQYL